MKTLRLSHILSIAITMVYAVAADAQLYQDASSTTAISVRDPARQSSTEIDAVINNPAGTAFFKDGWQLSLSGRITEGRMTFYGLDKTAEHSTSNVIPSLQAAYKKGKLALSLSIGEEGGYGIWRGGENVYLSQTLNGFNEYQFGVYKESGQFSQYVKPISVGYTSGRLYNFAFRFGGAYQVNDHFGVFAGVRVNYYSDNSRTHVNQWVRRYDGFPVSPHDYFKSFNEDAANTPYQYPLNNYTTHGMGITPVLGIHVQTGQFDFAAKYEFETKIHTSDDALSFHIPGLLQVGASWQPLENFKLSAGGSWTHQSAASVLGKSQSFYLADKDLWFNLHDSSISSTYETSCKSDSWDIAASATFSPIESLSFSVGYKYAQRGYMYKSLYAQSVPVGANLVAHTISAGVKYGLTDNIQLDFGWSKMWQPSYGQMPGLAISGHQTMTLAAGVTLKM